MTSLRELLNLSQWIYSGQNSAETTKLLVMKREETFYVMKILKLLAGVLFKWQLQVLIWGSVVAWSGVLGCLSEKAPHGKANCYPDKLLGGFCWVLFWFDEFDCSKILCEDVSFVLFKMNTKIHIFYFLLEAHYKTSVFQF